MPIADILFDHLVGARNQCLRHGDTERLGGSLIDYEFYGSGLLNWQISWLFAFENPASVLCQKRTCAVQKGKSALSPKADVHILHP